MADPFAQLTAFIRELSRRRVSRVAACYSGIAFAFVQIINADFGAIISSVWK